MFAVVLKLEKSLEVYREGPYRLAKNALLY